MLMRLRREVPNALHSEDTSMIQSKHLMSDNSLRSGSDVGGLTHVSSCPSDFSGLNNRFVSRLADQSLMSIQRQESYRNIMKNGQQTERARKYEST